MLNTHLSSACNDKKKLLNHENVLNQINYASFFFLFFFSNHRAGLFMLDSVHSWTHARLRSMVRNGAKWVCFLKEM